MAFEWDEAKRRANLRKHGVDFATALEFQWENAQVTADDRVDYGEERFIALGLYRGRVHIVIYTEYGPIRRIISIRKATRQETRTYEEEDEKNRP